MRVLLVVYDNGSYIHWFPLGTAYIASALEDAGHYVEIYNKDVYHHTPERLTEYLNANYFDAVGLGFVAGYWQYREAKAIARAINASENRPFFFLGGHGPSPEPDYFLNKLEADAVVIGEGELSVVRMLESNNAEIYQSSLIKDVDSISFPAWDLFPMEYYTLIREPHIRNNERCMPVITSRGCPFKCNFCYRMDDGVRLRSPESVVEEIKALQVGYGVSYIAFQDDLFMMSPKRSIELSEALMPLNIRWSCFGRLNHAKPEVLETMKRAGCVYIGYGIESLDDVALETMNKNLTVEQITKGIEDTLRVGISPGFNIIWGNIGETLEGLNKGVDFLMMYDDQSQLRTIRPVTPYPGSPLYYKAIEMGLLDGVEDFYENKHTNSDLMTVNFTDIPDDKFYGALYAANTKLLLNYHQKQRKRQEADLAALYFNHNTSFRGFRQT